MNNFYSISLDGRNYSLKYSSSRYQTLIDQFNFFRDNKILNKNKFIFMRVNHGSYVLEIDSENKFFYNHYSKDFETKCPSGDALYTRESDVTLCGLWSDCPHIVVKTPDLVGLIHASRNSLDRNIIRNFIEETKITPDNSKIIIANSIREKDFDHDFLGFKRADEWMQNGFCKKENGLYYLNLPKIIKHDFAYFGFDIVEDQGLDVVDFSNRLKDNHNVIYSHRLSKELVVKGANYKEGRGLIAVQFAGNVEDR